MKLFCLEHDWEPVYVEFKDGITYKDGSINMDSSGVCPKCNKRYSLRKLLIDKD